MISYLCSKKHDFYLLKHKIDLVKNYNNADLYLVFEIYEEEIYNLGIAKVTNEKLKTFLLDSLKISLADPLNMSLSVLCGRLLYAPLKEEKYKIFRCELKEGEEKIISFKLFVHIPNDIVKASRTIEDLVLVVEHPVIKSELFEEIMERAKEHIIRVGDKILKCGKELEINILEIFDIFFEEKIKGKNLFLFIDEIVKLRFDVSHCEVHSPYHKSSIRIVFRGKTTLSNSKALIIGDYDEYKARLLKINSELISKYFLSKIMELKKNKIRVTNDMQETIKDFISRFLGRIALEIFVKYIYDVGFQEFINDKVFEKIDYKSSLSGTKNFKASPYGIGGREFALKELYKSKNFIYRFFAMLLKNYNFIRKPVKYEGNKIYFYENAYGMGAHYDDSEASKTIFGVAMDFDTQQGTVIFKSCSTLINPRERIDLWHQEEVREDLKKIAEYLGIEIDAKTYNFMEKMIISYFFGP